MTTRNYSSNATSTTLSAPINDTQTTIAVSATTGYPAAPFTLALDQGLATQELVLVTAVTGLNLTVTRGYDSTTAQGHATGATVMHAHAAVDFRDSRTHENAASGVHGATGAVVGTTDTQTLTNKNLATGNVFPTTLATLAGTQTLTNKTLTAPALTAPTATGSLAGFGGAWTAYAPALANGGTQGNAVVDGEYTQIGKTVHFWARIVLGSTSSVSAGPIGVSLPVAAAATQKAAALTATFTDTGVDFYDAAASLGSTTVANAWVRGTNGRYTATSSTVPFTWGNGDVIEVRGTYEAA